MLVLIPWPVLPLGGHLPATGLLFQQKLLMKGTLGGMAAGRAFPKAFHLSRCFYLVSYLIFLDIHVKGYLPWTGWEDPLLTTVSLWKGSVDCRFSCPYFIIAKCWPSRTASHSLLFNNKMLCFGWISGFHQGQWFPSLTSIWAALLRFAIRRPCLGLRLLCA